MTGQRGMGVITLTINDLGGHAGTTGTPKRCPVFEISGPAANDSPREGRLTRSRVEGATTRMFARRDQDGNAGPYTEG